QRITGTRLHKQLLEEGFQVGITTVRNYLREKRRQKAEVFIPLVHLPADEAQVDFFEVTIDLNNNRQKVWMFVMRLMYCGRDFAWLYQHCDQVSFLDAHVRAFEHFGGVPARCIYDNLKPAVTKVMLHRRQLSIRFQALASHFLFEPCFARVGVGHDKGGVEARGKGIRWQHLTPIPKGKTLDELSVELLNKLDTQSLTKSDGKGRTVHEKYLEEKEKLSVLPTFPFESRTVLMVTASRQSTIQVKGATYSLPENWHSLEVTVFLGPKDLKVVCREQEIIRERVKAKEENISYVDYLDELSKKPQAVRQVSSRLLEELPNSFKELWRILEESHGSLQTARVFCKIVKAVSVHGEEQVAQAVSDCLEASEGHLLKLAQILREERIPPVDVPESLQSYEVESARASDFNHLMMGGDV
ncbi:MAG: IS21 family transposase, partial [Planctomycetota bacterium]|nr:IS21 family transposase [Planctomycetota bacterium]